MARQRDTRTLDLLRDYEPPPVVERFDPEEVKAWSLAGRLSKAVSRALNDADQSRDEIAAAMSQVAGETVSKALLDKYASTAAEDHKISALRLMALVAVTGDVRPLNTLLADIGFIVVPKKYEALLRREQAKAAAERAAREADAADAEWKASR